MYYLAGFCVQSLLKLRQLCCNCVEGVKHTDDLPHPKSTFLHHKNFIDGALFEVSDSLYSEFMKWERVVKSLESKLKSPGVTQIMGISV